MVLINVSVLPFRYKTRNPSLPKQHQHKAFPINMRVVFSGRAQVDSANYEVERRSAYYKPSICCHNFVESLQVNDIAVKMFEDRAKRLESEIRDMIENEDQTLLTVLELIDDTIRLGLAHHFQDEIHSALQRFVSSGGFPVVAGRLSLHAAALAFRLLRQNGYDVHQDVFEDFLDKKGNIKTCVQKDVKGLLSLYEASFLAYEEEDRLRNIIEQTKIYLNHLQENHTNIDTITVESIRHALEMPLYRRMVLLEARWYIESYNGKDDANQTLLELAKLHFNMVQSVLQTELKDMSRWWKKLGLASKCTFSRDRLMECFFWSVGMAFEPHLSYCRRELTKVAALVTTIDDVYDIYGTLEELEMFTSAVERWEISGAKNLPDKMKLCFLALYNTVNEMAYETLKEQGEDVLPYLIKAWSDFCKASLQEAKWSRNKCTPSFKDYLENGWRSVSGTVALVHAYFLLKQGITEEALDGLVNYHELLRWPSVLFRLYNDLATSSDEMKRGETANSITCYKDEKGVSEEDARKDIQRMIDGGWEEIIKQDGTVDGPFAEPFRKIAIDLARMSSCAYQRGDSHGNPNALSRKQISPLIIEPA